MSFEAGNVLDSKLKKKKSVLLQTLMSPIGT
jgi:hypothetical protein